MDERDLDDLFADAGKAAPPDRLMGRVLAEAEALQPRAPAPQVRPTVAPGFGGLWALIGGWRGLSGLGVSVAAGFWLGFADPAELLGQGGSYEMIELMPDSGDSLFGGEETGA